MHFLGAVFSKAFTIARRKILFMKIKLGKAFPISFIANIQMNLASHSVGVHKLTEIFLSC